MSPITDPPLDTLKPVAGNLWIVDSGPLHAFGLLPLPVRMSVVRLSDGTVWLHSPTRYDAALHRAILELGPVRHIVAPNVAHWVHLAAWQRHCPEATTWAAPNLRRRGPVRRAALRLDRDLGETAPEAWAGDIAQTIVPGGLGFREVAFFHQTSRSLILTDLVVNLEPGRLPLPMRPLARLAGITAPDGRAPIYLRAVVRLRRAEAARAAGRLLAWGPERVLFAHGAWFARDGAAALRRSLRWLGPGL